MFLRELFEAPKTAVFAFGRMNPPTIGHAKLADVVKSQQGDPFLFLSQTQKPKTDPLPFPEKMYFASKSFPGVEIGDPKVKTIIQAMQNLEAKGYTDIVYVAGSDRVDSFTKLLNDYNGKDYKFNSINIVSAGERDPDAEGAEGMSASKMRAAAQEGDYDSFKKGVASPMFALSMYDQVRKGMGIATEDESLDEWAVPALRGLMAVGKIGKFFWNNKWAIGFLTATWKVYPWVRDAVKWANRFLDHPVTQALGRYGLPAVGIAVALYGGTKLYNELIKTKDEKELEKVLTQFEVDRDELNKLEDMLISAMKEGDGRKKGIHGKGHPMRKKQQAAIHANESSSNLEQDLIDMYKGDGEAGLAMYMVDYLKFTEKEVSQAFKKAGGDIYKMISNVASMKNEGDLIPNPKSSTLAKSDTAYDFIKLGTHLANTDTMDPDDVNPSEPDVMIVPFSPEEDEIIKVALKKMGYKTQDAGGNKDAHYDENFADGKKPGRKGLAKRSGVDTKASVSSLRKTAKGSSGEKQRMAHWMANMKAGKAKAK